LVFVDNQGVTDAHINLAIEEHILRNLELQEGRVFLYINQPSIIVGRNQNPYEEANLPFAEAQHLPILRRLSGGGTVYHDLGNLNFSFITLQRPEDFHNFRKFTTPILSALQGLGIDAQLNQHNDIVVAGRKVSGNAQYIAGGRILTHGTLLFDSDLSNLALALKASAGAIASKSIKSVRSRVANLSEFLNEALDMQSFRLRVLDGIFAGAGESPTYRLTQDDWVAIRRISAERYQTWEWNFGRSPRFSLQKTRQFRWGEVQADLEIENGLIRSIQFHGAGFGPEQAASLEQALSGVRYAREHIRATVAGFQGSQAGNRPIVELARSLEDWLI
jgi:lipoate-protein ligase A